jgi:hypothetical protein
LRPELAVANVVTVPAELIESTDSRLKVDTYTVPASA